MTPQERRTKIVALLDHWPDFFEPASSGTLTSGGEPAGLPLLSSMAGHVSVRELGRCLELLRRTGPRHYAHLRGHFDAEWRNVTRTVKRRTATGRWVEEPGRVRERVVPAWVDGRLVDRGVDFLAGSWNVNRAGEPELPRPLTLGMRPLADSDGWTEAA